MIDATAIVLTKNEEINLPDCLKSLEGFAKRVVVVDSFSDDKTEEIAKKFGADFYQNKFVNYATQFNWALDNASISTKWVLRLDADERLTPDLCLELDTLTKQHANDNVNGIVLEAWLFFLGRKIKHGCPNKRKLMLFKTGLGRIENRNMDEHTILLDGISINAKNKFIHYDFKDLDSWISKMNWYASRELLDYLEYKNGKNTRIVESDKVIRKTRKKKFGFYYKLPLFFRCYLLFTYYYIFKFGFLDGKEGFVYHWMYHRWYRTLVDAKIYEQTKNRISSKKRE